MFDKRLSQAVENFAALMLHLSEKDLEREWIWKDHDYEAHFIQHTIQIDKTLVAIGQAPLKAKRLWRKIYTVLAEAQGMMIGAEKRDDTAILATASSPSERTREIENLLK